MPPPLLKERDLVASSSKKNSSFLVLKKLAFYRHQFDKELIAGVP